MEIISDDNSVYCRVHKANLDNRKSGVEKIKPVAFDPTPYDDPDGLSVNWDKYSTASETRNQVALFNKNPGDYAVVSFIVGQVRTVPLRVEHKPTKNKAHSLILDIPPRAENDAKKTLALRNICKLELDLAQQ